MSDDPHKQPNDFFIFAALVVALGGSLLLAALVPSTLTITMIFLIAGLKAYLVLTHFIHLGAEPRFIKVIVIGVLVVVAVLWVGLLPDITLHGGVP